MKKARSCEGIADFQIPTTPRMTQKLPDSAPVQIGLQLFSDNSVLCGLPGYQDKVVVMMMARKAQPSHFHEFESFGDFLKENYLETYEEADQKKFWQKN